MFEAFQSIVQHSRDYITLIDTNHRYVFVNDAYQKALGKNKNEIVGFTVEEVWGRARFEGGIEVPLRRCLEGEEVHYIDEFPMGESVRYVEVSFFPFRMEKDGPVSHALVFTHDISRLGELESRLMTYEFRDPATGLFNQRSLDLILDRELQNAELNDNANLRVLFVLGVENLSEIRRQHGSEIATLVVENLGLRLKDCLGRRDSVFRYEADELAALVTNLVSPMDAAPLAEKILTAMSVPYPRGVYEIRPLCRIGVAIYPRDALDRETLILRAVAALSSAREGGRLYQLYDADLHSEAIDKVTMTAQLRRGLSERRFELFFQPLVDKEGHIHGAEALIRWRHPEKGLLLPGTFFPLAVETGLNTDIEKYVIFTVARHLAKWKKLGIYVSINLSAKFFEDPSLGDLLDKARLQAGDVKVDRLKLEITESEGMRDPEKTMRRMAELTRRGYGIYIDDFGTGRSSMQYLKELPASVLKIDQSFVCGIERDRADREFLEHMIHLVKHRHRYIVVEGVENAAQAAILAGMDVDALQGFYYARPMSASDFENLVKSGQVLPVAESVS